MKRVVVASESSCLRRITVWLYRFFEILLLAVLHTSITIMRVLLFRVGTSAATVLLALSFILEAATTAWHTSLAVQYG